MSVYETNEERMYFKDLRKGIRDSKVSYTMDYLTKAGICFTESCTPNVVILTELPSKIFVSLKHKGGGIHRSVKIRTEGHGGWREINLKDLVSKVKNTLSKANNDEKQ